jgi:hypothetical protein
MATPTDAHAGLIDPATDELLTVPECAQRVLRKRIHPVSCWRWATKGVKGGIRLETVIVGRQRYTTVEAFADFIRRQTEVDEAGRDVRDAQRSPETNRRLQKAGLL